MQDFFFTVISISMSVLNYTSISFLVQFNLCFSRMCSHKVKLGVKLKADYAAVLHMPVLKEGKDRVPHLPGSMQGHQSYTAGEGDTAHFNIII